MRENYGYTKEQIEWLKINGGTMPYHELAELFNKTFNEHKSYDAIRTFCRKKLNVFIGINGFTKDMQYKNFQDFDDLLEMFFANKDMPLENVVNMFNTKHSTFHKEKDVRRLLAKKGYRKRDFGHRQGNVHNETPLGSIKTTTGGYEVIKVKQGTKAHNYADGWTTLANYKYEQYHNKKVGEKELVVFANGNNRDYRKENLVKITWSERLQLNQAHAIGNEEYMRTMLEIIRAKQKIREVANEEH